jgi:ADP-ribose pyrophosphatase YjhB (NUDIX family)
MSFDRSYIRVKAMLVAVNEDLAAYAVSLHPPTVEDPDGYHRLIGGSVDVGEKHRDAVVREVREELAATVHDLTHLDTVESIFRRDGQLGHNVVFIYAGRLAPMPPTADATLTEDDGTLVPVVWRSFSDDEEPLRLHPPEALPAIRRLREGNPATGGH